MGLLVTLTRWPTCGNTDVPLDYSGGISQDCQRGTYLTIAQVVSPIIASLLLRLPRNWLGCAWLAKVYRSIGETLGLTTPSCVIHATVGNNAPPLDNHQSLSTINETEKTDNQQGKIFQSSEKFFRTDHCNCKQSTKCTLSQANSVV